MQKKLFLLVLLAAAAILLLHGCGKDDTADDGAQGDTQQAGDTQLTGSDGDTQLSPRLGTLEAREDGGVTITATAEDGTESVYTYTDVSAEEWYADAVNYVVTNGVMSGDDAQQLFRPEYGVERSQFAVIICRFAGGEPTQGSLSFSDLTGEEWYYDYVNWMVDQGLMGGTDGAAFDPDSFLSCEQAIIVLYRLAGEPAITGTLEGYPYAPKVSDSGHDAVTWAWNNGLITEKECVWYPTQAVSRAQVALMLLRYDTLFGSPAA